MEKSTFWDIFAQTGKIDDYLAYRRACLQTDAAIPNEKETEDAHATNHQQHRPAAPTN